MRRGIRRFVALLSVFFVGGSLFQTQSKYDVKASTSSIRTELTINDVKNVENNVQVDSMGDITMLNNDGTVGGVSYFSSTTRKLDISDLTNITKFNMNAMSGCFAGITEDKKAVYVDSYGKITNYDLGEEWCDIKKIITDYNMIIGIKENGTVVTKDIEGNGDKRPDYLCKLDQLTNIVDATTGTRRFVVVKDDGSVVDCDSDINSSWNSKLKLWSDVVAIDSCGYNIVGLKSDGTAEFFSSYNESAEMKKEVEMLTNIVSIKVGASHVVALKSDGTVVTIGKSYYGECDVQSWNDIVGIKAIASGTIGIKKDGTIVSAGLHKGMQNINVNWDNIKNIGEVWSGNNGHPSVFALKDNGDIVRSNTESYSKIDEWKGIQVLRGQVPLSMSSNAENIFGVTTDGKVVSNEVNNRYGQCNIKEWENIVDIGSGFFHTIGLKNDGTVVATGSNGYGACNVGTWNNIIDIAISDYGTFGLKKDGTVVATGNNSSGQCEVGNLNNVVQIVANSNNMLALMEDGTVTYKGKNINGECNVEGWNDIKRISSNEKITIGLKNDGTVVVTGESQLVKDMGDLARFKDIKDVVATKNQVWLLKEDGTTLEGIESYGGRIAKNKKDIIEVDKKDIIEGEIAKIKVFKNPFYTIENLDVLINGKYYKMEEVNPGEYELQYKADKAGNANIKFLGVKNLFGETIEMNDTLRVAPKVDIKVNKNDFSPGEIIKVTLEFSEKIISDVNIDLEGIRGARGLKGIKSTVDNKTKYEYEYEVPNELNNAFVNLRIKNVVNEEDQAYNMFSMKNILGAESNKPVEDICDFNKDNKVDLLDLSIVCQKYNTYQESSQWDSILDLNKDGIIEVLDLVIVARKIEI